MQTVVTLEARLDRVRNYVEIFTGKTPAANEMARFRSNVHAASLKLEL